jgi:hypothetical protein
MSRIFSFRHTQQDFHQREDVREYNVFGEPLLLMETLRVEYFPWMLQLQDDWGEYMMASCKDDPVDDLLEEDQ